MLAQGEIEIKGHKYQVLLPRGASWVSARELLEDHMAISGTHYRLLKSIQPLLPNGGRLLEIGEANWYGDLDPSCLYDDIIEAKPTDVLSDKTKKLTDAIRSGRLHDIAKACYAALFSPREIVSVDINGTAGHALRQDLNASLQLGEEPFDLVINHGTAEHVFNIAQVFKSAHDACCTFGLMIHESPFTGWVDHGFYCLQPTLFYDLAAANNYEVVKVAVEHIESGTIIELSDRDHANRLAADGTLPNNAMLYVVYKKLFDTEFMIPVQGYYARNLSDVGMRAWSENRK